MAETRRIEIPRPSPDNWQFGITLAKHHPEYVYSANGMGVLMHKVAKVEIHWWERSWSKLIRLNAPMMIATTVCGMHKRLSSGRMQAAMCALPKPDAVLCGKCHGQPCNFPRKNPQSKAARREAKKKLGCIAMTED